MKKKHEYNTEYIHAALSLEKKLVLIQLINALFLIERESKARGHSPEQRHRFLDDEEAFKKFPHDGRIEMHNNAVESVFRHIAMGRRNWLNSGSHEAAQNIAFMYSLYESCKMNDIDFGEYVEDILTRMMNGDNDYESMIPCRSSYARSCYQRDARIMYLLRNRKRKLLDTPSS